MPPPAHAFQGAAGKAIAPPRSRGRTRIKPFPRELIVVPEFAVTVLKALPRFRRRPVIGEPLIICQRAMEKRIHRAKKRTPLLRVMKTRTPEQAAALVSAESSAVDVLIPQRVEAQGLFEFEFLI